MTLELMAMEFLRFEKRCPVALFERTPRAYHGQPDVLGVTKARFLLEIEIKRSMSDFKANFKKPHIARHDFILESDMERQHWPKQYWYLVPNHLVEVVTPWVPAWAGLLRGPGEDDTQCIHSVIKAPVNQASQRIDARECMKLGHCMANQIYCQQKSINRLMLRTEHENWAAEYEI